jgi:hypothetical protein
VPVGILLVPFALAVLADSRGPSRTLDLRGVLLASSGLLGIVFGIVRSQALGWTSPAVLASIGAGAVLLAAFVAWELRAPAPMLPMRFFRNRAFAATNGVSLAMFFGAFGSIFLLAQFFQVAEGYSPLEAGVRTLPWTAMPIFVAPVAGAGMALVFAPAANAVLGSVRPGEAGQASGATNTIREIGGVLGVAILATVFTSSGSYGSPQGYVDGLIPAVWVGSAVLAAGALVALVVPRKRAGAVHELSEPLAVGEAAAA